MNKRRVQGAAAAAAGGILEFPVPGAQNIFDAPVPFTARGNLPAAGNVIRRVRLFRPGMPPLVGTLVIDAMAGTWAAEFPINGPADLPPNQPNYLVIEVDGIPRRQYAVRFSHVSTPPTIDLRSEARPNHETFVQGQATGLNSGIANEFTLLVGGYPHGAIYNNNTQEFEFTTPSTSSPTQELIIRVQNASGAYDDFPFTLTVDQEPPLFDPDPPTLDTLSDPPNFIFTGTVVDEESGFENTDALVVKLEGQTNGLIDPANYDVRPILSADSKTIDFTITVDTDTVGPDFYTLTLDATDVAGNTRRATKIFLVT